MADIGSILRETRMRARIDISQVEADTKIRGKYLRALENEEWSLLPGDVYVRTFMRTYAEYLGIDPRPLVDEYDRRTQFPPERPARRRTQGREPAPRAREQSARRPEPRPNQRPQRVISPPVLIGAALVLIVVALWIVGNLTGGSGKPPSSAQVTTTPTTVSRAQKTTDTKTRTTKTTTTTVAKTTATLKIVPTGTIYVCVEDPTGKQLIANTYTTGESVPLKSGNKLLVTLGNAEATLTVNGKPYTPSADKYPIGLEILPTGVKTLTLGPQCT